MLSPSGRTGRGTTTPWAAMWRRSSGELAGEKPAGARGLTTSASGFKVVVTAEVAIGANGEGMSALSGGGKLFTVLRAYKRCMVAAGIAEDLERSLPPELRGMLGTDEATRTEIEI